MLLTTTMRPFFFTAPFLDCYVIFEHLRKLQNNASDICPPSTLIDIEDLSLPQNFTNIIICGNFKAYYEMWHDGMPNMNSQHFINFIDK